MARSLYRSRRSRSALLSFESSTVSPEPFFTPIKRIAKRDVACQQITVTRV